MHCTLQTNGKFAQCVEDFFSLELFDDRAQTGKFALCGRFLRRAFEISATVPAAKFSQSNKRKGINRTIV